MKLLSRCAPPRSFPRAARRRGQALLVAVVLMIIAAFLGSTFVAVVMINVQHTARS